MSTLSQEEFSRKIAKTYPAPSAADKPTYLTHRELHQYDANSVEPDMVFDEFVTKENQAELREKEELDVNPLEVIGRVIFFGNEILGLRESDVEHKVTQKKQLLNSLREFTGWTLTEAKSLAFPKGNLNSVRITHFVLGLQSYRQMCNDTSLTVRLELVDAEGNILLDETKSILKTYVKPDQESSLVLALLKKCEQAEKKKRFRTQKNRL